MTEPRKRVRRSVEASRLAILEMAERHLIAEGPGGVRVQKVARDLGLTDAAVHYHFRGRQELMETLLRFSGRRFVDQLGEALAATADGGFDLDQAAGLLRDFYQRQGAGRLIVWLSLEGWTPEGSGFLEPLADRLHAARAAMATAEGAPAPDRRDSQMAVATLNAVALVQSLTGDALQRSVALDDGNPDTLIGWIAALAEGRPPASTTLQASPLHRRPERR